MAEVTIVETPESVPASAPLETLTVAAEAETNANDVAIAEIEAGVAVAQIEASAEVEAIHAEARVIEAINTNEENVELIECQNLISRLQEQVTALELLIASAPPMVAEPQLSPLSLEEQEAETLAENNLTPQSTSEQTSETLMDVLQESAADAVTIPPVVETKKWKMRLV